MNKKNNGFVGIDMTIAVMAIIIFSGLIIFLMYNNFLENVKIKREALATIYLTETLENIGIESYDNINIDNKENLISANAIENGYDIQLTISDFYEDDTTKEDIIKKVVATISYKIGNKNYQHSMERVKIKE